LPRNKIALRFKPLLLKVPKEREELYAKLKGLLRAAKRIADNTSLKKAEIRLRAMQTCAYIAQVMLGAIRDFSDDKLVELEKEVEELKKLAKGEA
jgi:tRNA(Ile)-lysidine synthase TilS/MesJ